MNFVQSRHASIRRLWQNASPEQQLALLDSLLDISLAAQSGPDVGDYGIDGSIPPATVEAQHDARSAVAQDFDSAAIAALTP